LRAALPRSPGSSRYGIPPVSRAKWGDGPTRPISRRRRTSASSHGTGILTRFPSATRVTHRLRTDSPSANDWCRGTLALSVERILTSLCCYFHQDSHFTPVHATSRPRFWPARTPPYQLVIELRDLGSRLSPVHFQDLTPRRVSFYTLLRGWLLLGPPPRCLRRKIPLQALSRHFGALIAIWVVSLSARELIPRNPTPAIYTGDEFGV
jgi:hypothetical protein